ncbi:MAG TPA: tetratricopeptide repeat protein [Acidobacteriaceae bacterium]|jgi:Flp pilus assembly protein TadD/mono/diheme cytochrome c family protein|nr:tetratricopeptide repeat protein [Acidobacteriaceae bacterium]
MKNLRLVPLALAACALLCLPTLHRTTHAAEAPVTWSRQIAPIVYQHCSTCHHPGGGGPFNLLTYQDARRRGPQMVQVTQSRFMPPWLPQPGYGDFVDDRRISDDDIALIRRWVATGMPQGNPSQAPPAPHYNADWQIGKPDLVLTVPRSFTLKASGTDVFHNFILPNPLTQTHYIRAMQILPSVPQVVHHANVLIDRTASWRHAHPSDWQNGFGGMELEVDAGNIFDPDSHFLFWKPDTPVLYEPPGMPWRLDPGNDLILNMHLKPSGKPEIISARIGLYFADTPAKQHPMLLQLDADEQLNIPAGDRSFVVQDSLRLPLDVEALGIYPHAHYLGHILEGWADLPNGHKKWLIRIPNWDIDRQSVFRYRTPVFLPRGSVLHMRYVYDNSEDNVHNPNDPPIRVRAGNRSVDEMGHLWIQVLPLHVPPGSPDPRLILEEAWMEHRLTKVPGDDIALYNLASAQAGLGHYTEAAADYRKVLSTHPGDPRTLNSLGAALENAGDSQAAAGAFTQAIDSGAPSCDARFNLAQMDLKHSDFQPAELQFRQMIQHCPDDPDVHSGLGVALTEQGNATAAQPEFQRALRLDPTNFTALTQLGQADIESGQPQQAIPLLQTAVQQQPDDLQTRERLAMALSQSGRGDDALRQLREAALRSPADPEVHALLAQLLNASGQLPQAIAEQRQALHLQPDDADGWNNLGVLEARSGLNAAARADFLRALQLNPSHAQARANLSRLPPR